MTELTIERREFGFAHRSRGLSAAALLVIFIIAQSARADAPAPTPATQPVVDDTPRKFLEHTTNDLLATMSVDQAMNLIDYNPNSDKDKAAARLLAIGMIDGANLELAARKKWGKAAETAVAHACSDNVPEDNAKAEWTINGDHASAVFQLDDLDPVFMAKINGHWKYDLAAYRNNDDTLDRDNQLSNTLEERLILELARPNAFANADAFVRHVNDEMDKLDN